MSLGSYVPSFLAEFFPLPFLIFLFSPSQHISCLCKQPFNCLYGLLHSPHPFCKATFSYIISLVLANNLSHPITTHASSFAPTGDGGGPGGGHGGPRPGVAGRTGHAERAGHGTGGRHALRPPLRLPRHAAPIHHSARTCYLSFQVSVLAVARRKVEEFCRGICKGPLYACAQTQNNSSKLMICYTLLSHVSVGGSLKM